MTEALLVIGLGSIALFYLWCGRVIWKGLDEDEARRKRRLGGKK